MASPETRGESRRVPIGEHLPSVSQTRGPAALATVEYLARRRNSVSEHRATIRGSADQAIPAFSE